MKQKNQKLQNKHEPKTKEYTKTIMHEKLFKTFQIMEEQ